MDFGQQPLLLHHLSDYLCACDWNHTRARVYGSTISKRARLHLHRPFFHISVGEEFASKEGEYIRNIHISMLMRRCHSAFTLCAPPRSRRPLCEFPIPFLSGDMLYRCSHLRTSPIGPVLFPWGRKGNGNICKRRHTAKHVGR